MSHINKSFDPTSDEIATYRSEHICGMEQARHRLVKEKLISAASSATSVEDLKLILTKLTMETM